MAVIPPHFFNCVVAIGNRNPDETISWVGTGFFYGSKQATPPEGWNKEGQRYLIWLVTNKHVVQLLKNPIVRIDSQGSEALQIPVQMLDAEGDSYWKGHDDPDVDVSITPINHDFLAAIGAKFNFFMQGSTSATIEELKEMEVSEGIGGFLLGFPMGIVSGPTNAVIVRKSYIAKIRDTYEGNSKSILIDGAVFPGNSGGAAVINPELMAIEGTKALPKAYLIGVVASYVPYIDTAYSTQTNRPRITFEENSGLTNIFPVNCIHEIVEKVFASKDQTEEQATVPSPEIEKELL